MISSLFAGKKAAPYDPKKRTAGGVLSPTTDILPAAGAAAAGGAGGAAAGAGVGGGVATESAHAMLAAAAALGLRPRADGHAVQGALTLLRPPGPFLLCNPRPVAGFSPPAPAPGGPPQGPGPGPGPGPAVDSELSATAVDALAAEVAAYVGALVIERKPPSPPSRPATAAAAAAAAATPAAKAATPSESPRMSPLAVGKEAIRDLFGGRARSPSLVSDDEEEQTNGDDAAAEEAKTRPGHGGAPSPTNSPSPYYTLASPFSSVQEGDDIDTFGDYWVYMPVI
jgi:hypothetical protein